MSSGVVYGYDLRATWFPFCACQCEGYRHPSPTTVARTVRILHTLLALVGKHLNCDKFEVNSQSVAYLAGQFQSQSYTLTPLTHTLC